MSLSASVTIEDAASPPPGAGDSPPTGGAFDSASSARPLPHHKERESADKMFGLLEQNFRDRLRHDTSRGDYTPALKSILGFAHSRHLSDILMTPTSTMQLDKYNADVAIFDLRVAREKLQVMEDAYTAALGHEATAARQRIDHLLCVRRTRIAQQTDLLHLSRRAFERATRDGDEPTKPLHDKVLKLSATVDALTAESPPVDDFLDINGAPRQIHSLALRDKVTSLAATVDRLESTPSHTPRHEFAFTTPATSTPPSISAARCTFATPHGPMSTGFPLQHPNSDKTRFGGDTSITIELQRLAKDSAIRQVIFFIGHYDSTHPRSTVFEDSHRKIGRLLLWRLLISTFHSQKDIIRQVYEYDCYALVAAILKQYPTTSYDRSRTAQLNLLSCLKIQTETFSTFTKRWHAALEELEDSGDTVEPGQKAHFFITSLRGDQEFAREHDLNALQHLSLYDIETRIRHNETHAAANATLLRRLNPSAHSAVSSTGGGGRGRGRHSRRGAGRGGGNLASQIVALQAQVAALSSQTAPPTYPGTGAKVPCKTFATYKRCPWGTPCKFDHDGATTCDKTVPPAYICRSCSSWR